MPCCRFLRRPCAVGATLGGQRRLVLRTRLSASSGPSPSLQRRLARPPMPAQGCPHHRDCVGVGRRAVCEGRASLCHNPRNQKAWGGGVFWATSDQAEQPVIFGEASPRLFERRACRTTGPTPRVRGRPENNRLGGKPAKPAAGSGAQNTPPPHAEIGRASCRERV